MNKEKIIDALENLSEIVNREEHDPFEANGIDRAIAAIQDLPDADQWIPVSERLPKDIVNPITRDAYVYPVTVDLGGITDIRYYSFCRGHWYNQGPKIMDYLVLAWMPLPEPYNPQNRIVYAEDVKGCSGECYFCPEARDCEQCGSV